MTRLAHLATVLDRLKADDYANVRHMTLKLPRSRRKKAKQPSEVAC